jgi:hypothetical protein
MKKIAPFLCMILFSLSVSGQDPLAILKRIKPLSTNRSEVEKVGKQLGISEGSTKYEADEGQIDVFYSEEKCVGHGWNVPSGTVISFRLFPKKVHSIADAVKTGKDWFETGTDYGARRYTNKAAGTLILTDSSRENIEYIRFTPTAADSGLRCAGFPPYDPAGLSYELYQSSQITNIKTWKPAIAVGATIGKVRQERDLKGFIFIYCEKSCLNDCKSVKKKIAAGIRDLLDSKRLILEIGGFRDTIEVEAFIIPADSPPAIPSPFYPSKE